MKHYIHFKGHLYELLYNAIHSETMEEMVVYRSPDDGKVWVRPRVMFFEDVKKDGYEGPRFKECECIFTFNGKKFPVEVKNIPSQKIEIQEIYDSGLPIYDLYGNIIFAEGRKPQTHFICARKSYESIEIIFKQNIEPFEAETVRLQVGENEWILKNVICVSMDGNRALISYTDLEIVK